MAWPVTVDMGNPTAKFKLSATFYSWVQSKMGQGVKDSYLIIQYCCNEELRTNFALKWMISFLTDQTQLYTYNEPYRSCSDCCTACPKARCSVRYSSKCTISAKRRVSRRSDGHKLHQYADDCQVYLSIPAVDWFSHCVVDLKFNQLCAVAGAADTVCSRPGAITQLATSPL